MGKNLKGKECGKGICQRKDGKYAVRYTGKNGKRQEKHFLMLPGQLKAECSPKFCRNYSAMRVSKPPWTATFTSPMHLLQTL